MSTATASRALSGSDLISEATVDRIRAVADACGYRPNVRARNFRNQKTMAVLIVVRDISNPFYLEVFKGVERVARQVGYSVLMANTESDIEREAEYFEMLRDGLADGMILMTGAVPETVLKRHEAYKNVVVALEMIEEFGGPQILIDNEASAKAAVNHLLSLGHTRIAHIAGPLPEGMSVRYSGRVIALPCTRPVLKFRMNTNAMASSTCKAASVAPARCSIANIRQPRFLPQVMKSPSGLFVTRISAD